MTLAVSDSDSIGESEQEMGFLLVEDCTVFLRGITKNEACRGWMTLREEEGAWQNLGTDSDTRNNNVCSHGELILTRDSRVEAQKLATDDVTEAVATTTPAPPKQVARAVSTDQKISSFETPRTMQYNRGLAFNGMLDNVTHIGCCKRRGKRSDASLVVGLIQTSQALGDIAIRKRVLLLRRTDDDIGEDGNVELSVLTECRAALLLTFDVNSPPEATTRKRKTYKVQPATQLLLSMMRSDWENLPREMEALEAPIRASVSSYHLRSDGTLATQRQHLFPSRLSLEELYRRLHNVGREHDASESANDCEEASLGTLPSDVLMILGSFLMARSLDRLRCSCRILHSSLRGVVPGLKLRLYKHQVRSLSWMRMRETRAQTEQDALSATGVISDIHRAMTGGATTLLRPRTGGPCRRVDQRSLSEFQTSPRGGQAGRRMLLSRRAARGGLLCDDPGLGKTITVLSLVLQTMGLTSVVAGNHSADSLEEDTNDETIFDCYWREEMTDIFRRPALMKTLNKLRRSHRLAYLFERPVDRSSVPDYYDVITSPMCFRQILTRIEEDEYSGDFGAFASDVQLVFSNAMQYNAQGNPIHEAARDLSAKFDKLISSFKEEQINSATKSFANASSKPNSSIAAILERRANKRLIDSLKPSWATLLVVPGNLLDHWVEQINLHVDWSYCSNRIPLVFRSKDASSLADAVKLAYKRCKVDKTHFPALFIDDTGAKKLPPEGFLAAFRIVLSTTRRFTNEWKKGNFEEELKQKDRTTPSLYSESYTSGREKEGSSPLLKVHWSRLVVDEGHALGRGRYNSAILFASWISAERRWAMTGTPTPQTVSRSGLTNLRGLLGFLQHEFFETRLDGDKVWQTSISKDWNLGCLAAFMRLHALFSLLMVRHTKLNIDELPPPKYRKTYTTLSTQEVKAYNTLVTAVQANLLLTSMKGKTSGLQDSLLHKSQAKFAREAFGNIRLACCGGTRVVPTLTEKFWDETVYLMTTHNASNVVMKVVKDYLHRSVTEQFSSCMTCSAQLTTLLILPCGHMICTECIDTNTRCCPICGDCFDVDDFQRLQPGYAYNWLWNIEQDEIKAAQRSSAGNEAGDASNRQDGIQQNPLAGPVGQVALRPPPPARRRTRRAGDGHECTYDPAAIDGKCTLCFEEHDTCVTLEEGTCCRVCHRPCEACPDEESKCYYLVKKLEELHALFNKTKRRASDRASLVIGEEVKMKEDRALKVIVFSQFRQTLNMVGHRLLRRFGAGMVAEYWGRYRNQELTKFIHSPDCCCMLLGKDGSEGLDLSMVTHIFFVEEVWDKSVEQQAIARAWRMGATGHVEVETLVARDSVEEMMMELEQKLAYGTSLAEAELETEDSIPTTGRYEAKDYQRTKLSYLLQRVRLMKDSKLGVNVKRRTEESDRPTAARKKRRVAFQV